MDWSIVAIGGAGGFVLNMFNLWTDSKRSVAERPPRDVLYWIFFVFWPIAGAGLTALYLYDGSDLKPLLAFSVGLSAPTTIQAMISRATFPNSPPQGAEP